MSCWCRRSESGDKQTVDRAFMDQDSGLKEGYGSWKRLYGWLYGLLYGLLYGRTGRLWLTLVRDMVYLLEKNVFNSERKSSE